MNAFFLLRYKKIIYHSFIKEKKRRESCSLKKKSLTYFLNAMLENEAQLLGSLLNFYGKL